MLHITIDGRRLGATPGETVLSVARRAGIDIPTLCHHDDLEPVGACRLCTVEVSHEKWSGRTSLVTACLYPVEDGLEVRTASEPVRRLRETLLSLLVARCPESDVIRALAKRHGATAGYVPFADGSKCILCGLCTRTCEAFSTSAIATMSRGARKKVGPAGDAPPAQCVGCGGCAIVCPTGHIVSERSAGALRIWEREFPLALCAVDKTRCRGCGACEEACPFSVPRVVVHRGGAEVATIGRDACRGCGVCVAACPTGAISQEHAPDNALSIPPSSTDRSRPEVLVVACGRASLAQTHAVELPAGAKLLELPCTGRASATMLLAALARGFAGVVVLGRHEPTCRLGGAEEDIPATVSRVERLARLVGLGPGRAAFVEPAAGRAGPSAAVASFLSGLSPTSLRSTLPADVDVQDSLDGAVAILAWLSERPELRFDGSAWLADHGLDAARPGAPALVVGAIPYLDLLAGHLVRPLDLGAAIRDALFVLRAQGIDAGVSVGGLRGGFAKQAKELQGSQVVSLCAGCASYLTATGAKATPFSKLVDRSALGAKAIDAGPSPVIGRFTVTEEERLELAGRLDRLAAQGARLVLAEGPFDLVQQALLLRQGTWRRVALEPVLLSTLAARALRNKEAAA